MTSKAKRCGFLEGVPDTKGGAPTSRSGSQSKFHQGALTSCTYAKRFAAQNQLYYLWSLVFPEEEAMQFRKPPFNEKFLIVLIAQFGCDNTSFHDPFCFSVFSSLNYRNRIKQVRTCVFQFLSHFFKLLLQTLNHHVFYLCGFVLHYPHLCSY